jgi:hypothetical protein
MFYKKKTMIEVYLKYLGMPRDELVQEEHPDKKIVPQNLGRWLELIINKRKILE